MKNERYLYLQDYSLLMSEEGFIEKKFAQLYQTNLLARQFYREAFFSENFLPSFGLTHFHSGRIDILQGWKPLTDEMAEIMDEAQFEIENIGKIKKLKKK